MDPLWYYSTAACRSMMSDMLTHPSPVEYMLLVLAVALVHFPTVPFSPGAWGRLHFNDTVSSGFSGFPGLWGRVPLFSIIRDDLVTLPSSSPLLGTPSSRQVQKIRGFIRANHSRLDMCLLKTSAGLFFPLMWTNFKILLAIASQTQW